MSEHSSERPISFVSRWSPIFGIVAIYLLAATIIGVQGEFPVNDDWIYTRAVKLFMNTKNLTVQGSVASCYLHILIGGAICSLTGFSYTALRIGELIISASGAIALYLTLMEIGLSRAVSFIFAGIYILNPWILNLSFTFMTDITALSLNNWYFYFIVRTLKSRKYLHLIAAALVLLASLTVRQTAIAYVLPNLVLLWVMKADKQKLIVAAFGLILFPFFLLCLLPSLMTANDFQCQIALHIQQWYAQQFLHSLKHHPLKGISQLISGLGQLACYLGLMVFPLLPSFFFRTDRSFRLPKTIWLLPAFVLVFSVIDLVFMQNRLMPFNANLFVPPWFAMSAIVGKPSSPLPHTWFVCFTCLSFAAGFCLLLILTRLGWVTLKNWQHQHLLSYFFLCALSTLGLVVTQIVFRDLDRYYVLCLAPILLSLARISQYMHVRQQVVIALPLTVLIGIYSVIATQDSLNAYRAQWSAIRSLEQKGINKLKIDGGWQYDALANADLIKQYIINQNKCGFPPQALGQRPLANDRFWPVNGEDYVISFSEKPGYSVISHHPYWSSIQWQQREILALKKNNMPN